MDTNKGGNRAPSALNPEIMAVGPERQREPQAEEGSGMAPLSANTYKGEKWKDVSTRLPTLALEIMAIGLECSRESQEEEGGGKRPRIDNAIECGRSGPSTPTPK